MLLTPRSPRDDSRLDLSSGALNALGAGRDGGPDGGDGGLRVLIERLRANTLPARLSQLTLADNHLTDDDIDALVNALIAHANHSGY